MGKVEVEVENIKPSFFSHVLFLGLLLSLHFLSSCSHMRSGQYIQILPGENIEELNRLNLQSQFRGGD